MIFRQSVTDVWLLQNNNYIVNVCNSKLLWECLLLSLCSNSFGDKSLQNGLCYSNLLQLFQCHEHHSVAIRHLVHTVIALFMNARLLISTAPWSFLEDTVIPRNLLLPLVIHFTELCTEIDITLKPSSQKSCRWFWQPSTVNNCNTTRITTKFMVFNSPGTSKKKKTDFSFIWSLAVQLTNEISSL